MNFERIDVNIMETYIQIISDFVIALASLAAFICSAYALRHNKWGASSVFLQNFDSTEMRRNRKIVYDFVNNGGALKDIGNHSTYNGISVDEKKKMDKVEEALTSVIAFYDGIAALTLRKYIPKKLFENTTLFTAAKFYNIAYEYINRRRLEDNRIYAINYTKLLSGRRIKRKIKKIVSVKETTNKSYECAYDNSLLCNPEYKKEKSKQQFAFERYKRIKAQRLKDSKPVKGLRFRKMIRPLMRLMLFCQRKFCRLKIEFINGKLEPTTKQRVFAVSHIGKWDFEIINEVLKPHFHILASDFINMHGKFAGWAMNAFGVIFVDEQDKEDRANSKKMMEAVLRQGDNMMIFPEAAWNLSENEIIYDIAFGAVDIAMATDSVIVPISMEQYGKRFVINIGSNFIPTDKVDSTRELRDRMASLKYAIWENKGITCRTDIPYDYWDKFVRERISEWPGYDIHAQVTDVWIPKCKREYFEILRDMRKLNITEKNCFMVMDKERYINKITNINANKKEKAYE